MHATGLQCEACGWRGPLEMTYQCPKCGYSLDVAYDYGAVDVDAVKQALAGYKGVWSFARLLPVKSAENIVTMQEGATPLVRSRQGFGPALWLKDETRNPTLAFKDRPNTVGISMARELGYEDVSIASTGNGGASLAAYAARAGMGCHVCVPKATPTGKVLQARYHGADLVLCEGDYSDSFHENCRLSEENRWANTTSTYVNPYTLEGDKTIAYEIFAQLGNRVPQWVIVPLGAGPMLTGIYKGFGELRRLDLCDALPRMAGVQAEGCAPIVTAWLEGEQEVRPWQGGDTVAGAIADPLAGYERDGTRTLRSIYASNGAGAWVTDADILEAVEELARLDGIFAEPASATVLCAARQLFEKGIIGEADTVVGIVTAHGLKDSEALCEHIERKG